MADYTSFASAPYPERPRDFYTGMNVGIQDQLSRMAQAQSMEHEGVKIDQSRANLERYQGMTPGEIRKSQLEELLARMKMEDPNYAKESILGEIGKSQVSQAEGKLKMGTLATDISTKNSKNKLDQLNQMQQYLDHYGNLIAMADASGGPGHAQSVYGQMRENLPDNVKSHLPETYDPKKWQAGSAELRKRLINTTEQAQKEQAEQKKGELHNKGTLDVARENSRGNLAVAQERIKSKNTTALQALQSAASGKMDPEKAWTTATIVLADPEISPATKAFAETIRKNVEPAYAEKLKKNNMMIKDGQIVPVGRPDLRPQGAGTGTPQGKINQLPPWAQRVD